MTSRTHDIPALAAEYTAAEPAYDASEQRLVLALFQLLGEGTPFGARELAERVRRPLDEVASDLDRLPTVQRDDQERVVAYGGLTLEPTSHALEVDGRTLHTWCALDTLFVPELLGRPARIRSTSPATGETISLTVDAAGVHDITPDGAVMTLHEVTGYDLQDVIGTFCAYVHYFPSDEAAQQWAKRSKGTYVVSIAEGFEFGRLYNHAHLGAALAQESA